MYSVQDLMATQAGVETHITFKQQALRAMTNGESADSAGKSRPK